MNVEDITRQIMRIEATRDQLDELAQAKRAELNAHAVALFKESRSPVTWRPPDLGTWSQGMSKTAPRVEDRRAWVAWVKQRYPTEVVEAVNEVFEKAILKRLTPLGEDVIDENTGEIVPGLGVRQGGRPLPLRFLPSGDAQAVADQHAAQLVKEITAGLGIGDEP